MELSQLVYFRAMAHVKHFTKAAKMISVSQSALSRSIKKLESELKVKLFQRNDKGITLTYEGQKFLVHAERILQELDAAKIELTAKESSECGTVHLSFINSLSWHVLPEIICDFKAIHPDINLRLDQNNPLFLAKQLERGKTDLCLCSTLISSENIAWNYLWKEELFIVVPKSHKLAENETITLKEVEHESFITLKPAYSLRIQADQLFGLANSHPKVIFEGDEIPMIANLVASGLGVGLIPRLPGMENLNLKFIPISFPICKRTMGIAWNTTKKLSPAAICFQQFVINRFST